MKRTLKPLRLSKSPLTLVLAQVRFSAVLAMKDYFPRIQDTLRRNGYPLNKSAPVQELVFSPGGISTENRMHWEVQTKSGTSSVIIAPDFVVFQTSAYETFEPFLAQLNLAVKTVSDVVGDLLVQRVGLRYVDALASKDDAEWRKWVKPGLHGLEATPPLHAPLQLHQTVSKTDLGTLVVRLSQNREGFLLPPDLLQNPPKLTREALEKGTLITLLDLDHFWDGQFEFSPEKLSETSWELHDALDQVFRTQVATEEGLAAWT